MMRKRLGRSGLMVSAFGLGTMNFGSQLDERSSHAIADAALDIGVNFFDTAEMYSSPPSPETYGLAESILGRWLVSKPRDSIVVATKVVGPVDGLYRSGAHIRFGQATLDRFHIARAIEASLARLGTDYIDLFQFHWPDRIVPWEEQLEAVDRAVSQGKIRYFGLSNETTWGLMKAIAISDRHRLVRPVAVQNILNLLEYEEYLRIEEACLEEGVGYVAYSPLAMGLLSGKYSAGGMPENSRLAKYPRYRDRYLVQSNQAAVESLEAIARRHEASLTELAYWWCATRPAVSVVLTSASKPQQLQGLLRIDQLTLSGPPDLAPA